MKRAKSHLRNYPKITELDMLQTLRCLDRIRAERLSLTRQISNGQRLITIAASLLAGEESADMRKDNVERLVGELDSRDWDDATKESHLKSIR